jgi:cytochrome c-type biogenesis protein CcmH
MRDPVIWVVFTCLAALAVVALLWPLFRKAEAGAARAYYDRNVFKDQLDELERDVARGTIAPAEAEAARNEISRRLLAVGQDNLPEVNTAGRAWVVGLTAVIVPALAASLYLAGGAPRLPDVPLRERMDNAVEARDFPAMIAQVEAHLRDKPDDLQGWTVLAPAYRQMGRYDDAANANRRLIALGNTSPEVYGELGEMLVLGNEGLVTAEALDAFRAALKADPKHPKSRHYVALALKQEGKTEAAIEAWKALLADSPADAPWREVVDREIMAAQASAMKPEEQQAMIRGMVDGLEERLKTDSQDIDGWLRLINARNVLGETDKARAAYHSAKSLFRDNAEATASLDAQAKALNLQ